VYRARRGDEEALAALIRGASPVVLAAARRVTRDGGLAEDAAQEAFLKAFRALDRYRPEASFRAWVRAIAIRCAIDIVRRRRPEYELSDAAPAAGDEEARHVDVDLLRAALESLPPLDREIMIAREVDGVSDRVIAERFDMSVTAVRVRMHRARRRIRARFEEARP